MDYAIEYSLMSELYDEKLSQAMEGAPVTNFTEWYGDPSMIKSLIKAGYGDSIYPSIVIHDPDGKSVLMVTVEGNGRSPRPNIDTKVPIMWVSRDDLHHVDKILNSVQERLKQMGYEIKSVPVENELFHKLISWVEDLDPEYYEVKNPRPVRMSYKTKTR